MRSFSLDIDPEERPSKLRAACALPRLLYRGLRWGAMRGGWLPEFWRTHQPFDRSRLPGDTPIDVMVLVSDHYEPARRGGDAAAVESVRSWCAAYEAMADKHRDADGRPPQHTWFYRYDYPNPGCVQTLCESVFRGFGEIEFHLHHGHDTHETLSATLESGLTWFNRFGAMLTAEARPQRTFAYVAGNSALDNGAGDDRLSGCDTEIRALRDAGCFADFTFPALGSPAQPRKVNSIYYATEDGAPKSYDSGVDVTVGGRASGDLMIFQGPVAVDWGAGRLEDGAVENCSPPHPRRLSGLMRAHVHVAGRPEWLFVKMHTHAMQNRASFLSAANDAMLGAMVKWWNRPPYRLHFVTAREAYNIVKAAEAGCSGDPNDYRDYVVKPPANRLLACSGPWQLLSWTPERIHVRVMEAAPTRLTFASGDLHYVQGRLREVEARYRDGALTSLRVDGDGPVDVFPPRHGAALATMNDVASAGCVR